MAKKRRLISIDEAARERLFSLAEGFRGARDRDKIKRLGDETHFFFPKQALTD